MTEEQTEDFEGFLLTEFKCPWQIYRSRGDGREHECVSAATWL